MVDELLAPRYVGWLLDGFGVTVALSLAVCIASTLLGMVLCLARLAPLAWVAWPTRAWLSFFRNTPLLVQLFFWYFGFSGLLPEGVLHWLNQPHQWQLAYFGLHWPSFEVIAGFFGLSLFTAAFIAEEIRAGISGVPAGQLIAARALGLAPRHVWLHVLLPQALRIVLPPLMGQYMNAVKNSSLTMAIGLAELSYASRQVETETFKTFQAFGIATVLYIATVVILALAEQVLVRRYPLRAGTFSARDPR